ncbi:hypothetical protein DEU56DRAFT_491858 [Suillus clintonianus]|uniref:uncharacterized protein n=1 Tax=Suillus clintonianus TaxID=1904413 RepID=UPI001B877E9C|nr:uncharacterized protein DEU56DRAFT_491858 [Suillus clintonianus]KAG2129794.1 hypothetical protein DEU56DRAFT_491858 [Suillus clintonianus]
MKTSKTAPKLWMRISGVIWVAWAVWAAWVAWATWVEWAVWVAWEVWAAWVAWEVWVAWAVWEAWVTWAAWTSARWVTSHNIYIVLIITIISLWLPWAELLVPAHQAQKTSLLTLTQMMMAHPLLRMLNPVRDRWSSP